MFLDSGLKLSSFFSKAAAREKKNKAGYRMGKFSTLFETKKLIARLCLNSTADKLTSNRLNSTKLDLCILSSIHLLTRVDASLDHCNVLTVNYTIRTSSTLVPEA